MSVVYHSLTTNYLIFLSEMIVKSIFFFNHAWGLETDWQDVCNSGWW